MTKVRAQRYGQQIPVVVLLIVALIMYALLAMRTTAQNILERPSMNLVRVPQGFSSSVQEGAIQIRETVRRQVNQPSTIGPTLPRVNANPAAVLRTAAASTELGPVAPVAPAPVIVLEPTKFNGAPAAAASKPSAEPGKKSAIAIATTAKKDESRKDKGNQGLTKGPDKRH